MGMFAICADTDISISFFFLQWGKRVFGQDLTEPNRQVKVADEYLLEVVANLYGGDVYGCFQYWSVESSVLWCFFIWFHCESSLCFCIHYCFKSFVLLRLLEMDNSYVKKNCEGKVEENIFLTSNKMKKEFLVLKFNCFQKNNYEKNIFFRINN